MASPENQDNKKKTSSRSKKHSKSQKQDSKPSSSGSKVLESSISGSQKVRPKKQNVQKELHLKNADVVNGAAKISNKSAGRRKKAPLTQRRSYSLRSLDSGRVLRSKLDKEKRKTAMKPASDPENLVTRKKKGGKKKEKKSGQDELSKMRKHIKYMLTRMNYEQNLIDAYSGEGWKGQSAEKIRPEKELERAKSEILRCKLKIRHIFQHLDSLLVEGRLQESLFDSDGIDCENIFCGKCGSKEVSADNDIILCDGICERGFHQKCLNPPLLSEEVPTGDEGWLCPHCDCKADCIDLLSEFRGTDLSIEDSWESIFPEAAVLANGNGRYDDLNLPSDDSEDDDYDPNARRVDEDEQEEGPDYEESDSSSSSYDSTSSDDNMNRATVELPTDDSEDDDYDPEAPDPDKEIHKSKSSSDESDFTSDSDEFCDELKKISYAEEASASSLPIPTLATLVDSGRDEMEDEDKLYDNSEVPCAEIDLEEQEGGRGSSHKRGRERLDYKKLYDEEYGKSSTDSSEDEDWNENSSLKKLRKTDDEQIQEKLHEAFQENQHPTKEKKENLAQELDMTYQQVSKWFDNARQNFRVSAGKSSNFCKATSDEVTINFDTRAGDSEPDNGVKGNSTVSSTPLKANSKKKLYEAFKENQYPTKEKKESLAQELDMTYQQVSKWYGNARHSFRVSVDKSSKFGKATSDAVTINFDIRADDSEPNNGVKGNSTVSSTPLKSTNEEKLDEAYQENQYPSREMKEKLAQELGLTFRKVSRWFENAQRRSHAATKVSSTPATSSTSRAAASFRTPTSNVNSESGVSPRDEVTTPKSRTSPWKPDHVIDLDSPIANGTASIEKGKNAADDQRKKAIAKELRKMRKRR